MTILFAGALYVLQSYLLSTLCSSHFSGDLWAGLTGLMIRVLPAHGHGVLVGQILVVGRPIILPLPLTPSIRSQIRIITPQDLQEVVVNRPIWGSGADLDWVVWQVRPLPVLSVEVQTRVRKGVDQLKSMIGNGNVLVVEVEGYLVQIELRLAPILRDAVELLGRQVASIGTRGLQVWAR